MNYKVNCHSLPPDASFAAVLAAWIMENYAGNAELFTKTLILLPNRRACRSLREAFLSLGNGAPMLLPRIRPLGDVAEDSEMGFTDIESIHAIPPAISDTRRELLLTRLVMHTQPLQIEQAADLARQLARLLDEVAREGLDFSALAHIVPAELSVHWQHTLDFLTIVSRHWPQILESEGVIDAVERRVRVLTAVAEAWKENPPAYPVIAAGSTGSQPSTANLIATIACLPKGAVILPGLDKEMPEREWEIVSETHPQYALKQLLKRMHITRADVQALQPQDSAQSWLSAVFQPPAATAHWADIVLPETVACNASLVVADTQSDEARAVAIALREALEAPHKTAAFITPDRALARMVVAEMQRFDIAIDDSAGKMLMDTPAGCFLRLAVDMVSSNAAPAELLALLRHPLAAVGVAPAECRRLSRLLETDVLRGVRHTPGLKPLQHAADDAALKLLLATLNEQCEDLSALLAKPVAPLKLMLEAHIALCERLADTGSEKGNSRLWAGEDGNALAEAIADLLTHADLLPDIDPRHYAGLLHVLLKEKVVRPKFGLHPRLAILGPLEARLQQFDCVILGGLNEGTWPALPAADPWMSRPMREKFGLPSAERSIGQSAHDFVMLAAANQVILTRARKVDGAPTVPSRWLVRIETLLKGRAPKRWEEMQQSALFARGVAAINAPVPMQALTAPKPVPPLSARPFKMNVTAIDTYLRDPYMIYAKHILGLKPLEPLDQNPDAADFGMLVHRALEQYIQRGLSTLDELMECGRVAFAEYIDRPAVACLWWPRFEAMAAWFIARQKERHAHIQKTYAELEGVWTFDIDGKSFTLTTRIDRLDEMRDGASCIIDYKTGAVPGKADIERGLANQLALEALVVMHGNMKPSPAKSERGDLTLEYWKLSGNAESCEIVPVAISLAEVRAQLEALIRRFQNIQEPYAAQSDRAQLMVYNDYEHLTRRQEWEAV